MEKLKESSNASELTIFLDWAGNWEALHPGLSTEELSERFQVDRALGFKSLITCYPKLNYLELRIPFESHREIVHGPHGFLGFESFPSVPELCLKGWSFVQSGPNTLQQRLDPSILQDLNLNNVFEIDNLFDVLLWNQTQLKRLSVRQTFGRRLRVPVGADRWPALVTFLVQQSSLEDLCLYQCN